MISISWRRLVPIVFKYSDLLTVGKALVLQYSEKEKNNFRKVHFNYICICQTLQNQFNHLTICSGMQAAIACTLIFVLHIKGVCFLYLTGQVWNQTEHICQNVKIFMILINETHSYVYMNAFWRPCDSFQHSKLNQDIFFPHSLLTKTMGLPFFTCRSI